MSTAAKAPGLSEDEAFELVKRLYNELMEIYKWVGYHDLGISRASRDTHLMWRKRVEEIVREAEELAEKYPYDDVKQLADLIKRQSKWVLIAIDSHLHPTIYPPRR